MTSFLFQNARLIFPTGIESGELLTRGREICHIVRGGRVPAELAGDATVVDCGGLYLSPGFIDVHCHGAGGYDYMDDAPEAIEAAARTQLAFGATTVLPTALTAPFAEMADFLRRFDAIPSERPDGPDLPGVHIEGPYFSPGQGGAQPADQIRDPDPAEYEALLALSSRILRWSFAVERPGATAFLRRLRQAGISSSLAHSDASCRQVIEAVDEGLDCLTHFYSAMSTVTRRQGYRVAGVVEAGYLLPELRVEVIADGCHLPAELLQLIYQVKGADRIILVSDSMRAAGLPEGPSVIGKPGSGTPCIVEGGVARTLDRSSFAGSVATADRLVRTMYRLTTAPLHEVVRMMTLNPAELVGLDRRKGSLATGKDADLLLFDEDIRLHRIFVRGEERRPG
ncbi:MAG: N-acetylglucosamine-6-phosphate deacetylase [Bacillota bacterium]|nr:N-acetylglucosamine-6-phosphate deacetylase [Bacillota bacterium]